MINRYRKPLLASVGALLLGMIPYTATFAVDSVDTTLIGLNPILDVSCENITNTLIVPGIPVTQNTWACSDPQLASNPGDVIKITANGIASDTNLVGGRIQGLQIIESVTCENLDSGQSISFQGQGIGWDCVTNGLNVTPGDTIAQQIIGISAAQSTPPCDPTGNCGPPPVPCDPATGDCMPPPAPCDSVTGNCPPPPVPCDPLTGDCAPPPVPCDPVTDNCTPPPVPCDPLTGDCAPPPVPCDPVTGNCTPPPVPCDPLTGVCAPPPVPCDPLTGNCTPPPVPCDPVTGDCSTPPVPCDPATGNCPPPRVPCDPVTGNCLPPVPCSIDGQQCPEPIPVPAI